MVFDHFSWLFWMIISFHLPYSVRVPKQGSSAANSCAFRASLTVEGLILSSVKKRCIMTHPRYCKSCSIGLHIANFRTDSISPQKSVAVVPRPLRISRNNFHQIGSETNLNECLASPHAWQSCCAQRIHAKQL